MYEIIFYIAAFFIMIDARVSLVLSRSQMYAIATPSMFSVIINFIGSIASLSIVIWGFLNLEWWIPIVTLLGMSFPAAFLVNPRLGVFIAIGSFINLIIISLALAIWLQIKF
jgi:hypothetical protein